MSQAKADCEALLNAAMPFAEQMLQRYREFFPFGSAMRASGEITAVAGHDGNEHPPSSEVIALIKDGFIEAARRNEFKATALVHDVKIKSPSSGDTSDAIAVALDHRDDEYSVVIFFPYRLSKGELTLDPPFAQAGEGAIFGGS